LKKALINRDGIITPLWGHVFLTFSVIYLGCLGISIIGSWFGYDLSVPTLLIFSISMLCGHATWREDIKVNNPNPKRFVENDTNYIDENTCQEEKQSKAFFKI
jgi:hypothetical protein